MLRSLLTLPVFTLLCISTFLASVSAQDVSAIRGYTKPKPNPSSHSDLGDLLEYPEIASEVGVDFRLYSQIKEKAYEVLSDQLSVQGAPAEKFQEFRKLSQEHDKKLRESLEELLTPAQLERLKQIAYRFEIGRIGFYGALSEGWLGENIRLVDPQREQVLKKTAAIEEEIRQKIKELNAEGEARILALLTPTAKREAIRLLGAPCDVKLRTAEELRMEKLKMKARENEAGADKKDAR